MVGFLEVRHVFHDGLSAYHGFTLAKVRKNITVSKDFSGSTPDYFSTFAQLVDLQSVASVLPVRFKRVPPVRFKRGWNEPVCRVKHRN